MGQVKTQAAPMFVSCTCDPGEIESLASKKVHTVPQHQGHVLAALLQKCFEILDRDCILPGTGLHGYQGFVGVQAVMSDLRLDGVEVGRESRFVDDHE